MLNVLSNFALKNFKAEKHINYAIVTEENEFDLENEENLFVYLFEDKDDTRYFVNLEGTVLREKETMLSFNEGYKVVEEFAPECLDGLVNVYYYELIPLQSGEDINFDLDAVLNEFKNRVNSHIENKEKQIRILRKSYGLLNNLQKYTN